MNWIASFASVALLLSVASAQSDVIDLTGPTFDQTIAQNPLIFVEFYAPWCGHCKHLAPEYEKVATQLKGKVLVAKVNGDEEENKPLMGRFGVQGFPTLKLFRNGQPVDYQGGRTADEIVSYLKKQSMPSVSVLSTKDEVNSFVEQEKVAIVAFNPSSDSAGSKNYHEVANALRDKFFFAEVVGNAGLAKEFGADSTPAVILFKQFDEGKNVLTETHSVHEISEFVRGFSVPLIDEIGPTNYQQYHDSGLPVAFLFINVQVPGQKEEVLGKVSDLAKETKGKLSWVYIDWAKYAKHSEKLGLSGQVVPALAIEEMQSGVHYAFDEKTELTTEAISAWVKQFLAKELNPTVKSQPIPEQNDAPVTVLVGLSFDEIVKDPTKDVMVEFYAPWCGHCKKLAPIFDELGTHFKDVNSVVIAKIDATTNDVDARYNVKGFPTIKFFPANNKNAPLDYNGDRSLDDMIDFIEDNAHVKIVRSGAAEPKKDEL